MQPRVVLQRSSVQGLPSLQFGGGPPTQTPPEQVSFVVHALWSSHGPGTGEPPWQRPLLHVVFTLQGLPSSQLAVLFGWTQPRLKSHESSVQGFPSSQLGGGPPTQLPLTHVSFTVHSLPSSQDAVLFVCSQPVAALHVSSVHRSASLQLGGGPPTQAPPMHVSAVVQALPSSQGAELLVCVHPVEGLQKSFVQGFPSPHAAEFPACAHPTAGLQESTVHGM